MSNWVYYNDGDTNNNTVNQQFPNTSSLYATWLPGEGLNSSIKRIGIEYIDEEGKCTSCNKKSLLVLKYALIGLDRKICRNCCIKVLDNLFNIKINQETEQILYGE